MITFREDINRDGLRCSGWAEPYAKLPPWITSTSSAVVSSSASDTPTSFACLRANARGSSIGHHLIEHSVVTGCLSIAGRKKSKHTQPILERDEDDFLRCQYPLRSVQLWIGRSEKVPSTMNEHHHRK
uniref:Uncharacterized protein n=1 Tax=Anopheles culicifacies TaxID=139723 RepID=A0A182M256_9DIPT